MKIKEIKPPKLLYEGAELTIVFAKGENKAVGRLYAEVGGIDQSKDYDVSIKPKRAKRSLDANAYLWALIGKLAERMCLMKTEVYKEYIKEMHTCETVPIKEEKIDDWKRDWERGHDGWACIDIGECKNFPGYHNIQCYRGSSTYDTKEMSQLIDMVVFDCKEQGIETLPPAELERLKAMWG